MTIELKSRDRRALTALILATMAYLLIAKLAIPTYDRIQTGSQAVARYETDLAKYRTVLASRRHYEQSLEEVRSRVAETEARLISGGNPSLSSVALQAIVENAAKNTNLALAQRTISPAARKDEFFSEISMTVSFEGTPNQLTSFLLDVRSAAKFVTVKSLQVAPLEAPQETPAKGQLRKTIKVNATLAAILANPAVTRPALRPVPGKD